MASWTGSYELRELAVVWRRETFGGPVQDVAMCTFHLMNLTGGAPDATWTTGDYTAAEALFDTWWTAILSRFNNSLQLAEYVWRADGPAFKPHGSSLAPTLRRVARSVPGTNVQSPLPPQVAMSVTEVTAAKFTVEDVEGAGTQLRNRWGRFYLPAPALDQTNSGRFTSAACTAVSNATKTLYNGLRAADLIPVMYSPTTGNSWSVDELHVDDICDVIRSRRYVTPLTRASTGPLT